MKQFFSTFFSLFEMKKQIQKARKTKNGDYKTEYRWHLLSSFFGDRLKIEFYAFVFRNLYRACSIHTCI